ncbi:GNAT family N-acetyltransferase [Streptomyces sp. NA04227]|uniref:GNAT family N-acetyltransferase n=1 Tax=Streptomyces sp. NA04227 TaxID=2742136 RepID=UPI0020CA99CE|nr:GNAT family N-acetyltransferase [Streptomyces sp. NA04227]
METRVRPMTEADCEAVGALRVDGWRHAYAGLMPQSHLDALDPAQDAEARRRLLARQPPSVRNMVAVRQGRIAGWACWGPFREEEAPRPTPAHTVTRAQSTSQSTSPDSELYALYADPEQLSTGLGRLLLQHCVTHCADAGYAHLRLWVLAGNLRARRFYERAGLMADGAEQVDMVDGVPITEVRYSMTLG